MSEINPPNGANQHPIEKIVDVVRRKQRNTAWPDLIVNASGADELMWKGSPRITKVQRIGVGLFGVTFLIFGISFASSFQGQWPAYLIAFASVAVGCKLLWNSLRKNNPPKPPEEEPE